MAKDPAKITADQRKATYARAKIGPPAVPPLVEALRDPDRRVRERAASALAIMCRPALGAVTPLVAALQDTDAKVRRHAAMALGCIGPAGPSVAGLVLALKDKEPPVRVTAAEALGMIGAKEAVPALTEATRDANPVVQRAAQQALRRLEGSPPPPPAPVPPKP